MYLRLSPHLARALALVLVLSLYAQFTARSFATQDTKSQNKVEVVVPDGSEFSVVTTEEISSKTATEGDAITFKVEEDVKINGHVVIAKDTIVKGMISSAERSGRMGKSGKLGIRVESTNAVDGQKIKLRASKGQKGDDTTGSVIALTVLVSPLFLLKRGKEAKIKVGTKLKVYTDEEKKIQAAP